MEATQSGQEITCQCGQRLEVPTMRKLSTLKRAKRPEKGRPTTSTWGARQAVLLIGIIITLGGSAFAARVYYRRPTIPAIQDLTPYQSWFVWQGELRPGLRQPPPWEQTYLEAMKRFRRWMGLAGTIVGLGVVTMISSLLIPRRGPTRRKKSGSRPPGQRTPNRR